MHFPSTLAITVSTSSLLFAARSRALAIRSESVSQVSGYNYGNVPVSAASDTLSTPTYAAASASDTPATWTPATASGKSMYSAFSSGSDQPLTSTLTFSLDNPATATVSSVWNPPGTWSPSPAGDTPTASWSTSSRSSASDTPGTWGSIPAGATLTSTWNPTSPPILSSSTLTNPGYTSTAPTSDSASYTPATSVSSYGSDAPVSTISSSSSYMPSWSASSYVSGNPTASLPNSGSASYPLSLPTLIPASDTPVVTALSTASYSSDSSIFNSASASSVVTDLSSASNMPTLSVPTTLATLSTPSSSQSQSQTSTTPIASLSTSQNIYQVIATQDDEIPYKTKMRPIPTTTTREFSGPPIFDIPVPRVRTDLPSTSSSLPVSIATPAPDTSSVVGLGFLKSCGKYQYAMQTRDIADAEETMWKLREQACNSVPQGADQSFNSRQGYRDFDVIMTSKGPNRRCWDATEAIINQCVRPNKNNLPNGVWCVDAACNEQYHLGVLKRKKECVKGSAGCES